MRDCPVLGSVISKSDKTRPTLTSPAENPPTSLVRFRKSKYGAVIDKVPAEETVNCPVNAAWALKTSALLGALKRDV